MRVKLSAKPVMTVDRRILTHSKLVYLLIGPKWIKYANGRSRIAYIGTTKKGAHRIASSAAHRAEDILTRRGFRELSIHVVHCKGVQGIQSWKSLERALIAEFRATYFQIPTCNKQGKSFKWTDKLQKQFRRTAIARVIKKFDC